MVKETTTTKTPSMLSRRLKKLIEKQKHLHNPVSWLPVKDKTYSIVLSSNDEVLRYITFTILIGRLKFRFLFPKLIKPYKTAVYKELTGFNRKGWVYEFAPRIYGIGYLPNEGIFHLFYGVHSGNRRGFPTDKVLTWIPTWYRYRLTKHSILDKNDITFWENKDLNKTPYETTIDSRVLSSICPKFIFRCNTEDSCTVIGSAYIEELEWSKGFPFLRKKVKTKRVLKVHLQVNSLDPETKPYSLEYDYTMLNNETIRQAVVRFCCGQDLEEDIPLRLCHEHVELEDV